MKYLNIANHYKECFLTYGDTHLGVDWPNKEDTIKRHEVMYEIINRGNTKIDETTILDFGCGLGHFYEWLLTKNKKPKYYGLDINTEFYDICKIKYPNVTFYNLDILTNEELPNFDYIIINGVFTEKRDLTQEEMFDFFKTVIKKLWVKCNKGLSFNLMSKHVDWERDDLFHVSLDELGWFLKDHLSRDFIIRNDYKLYEYTTYVYKK
jgi:SAM-dependent methyltransferase